MAARNILHRSKLDSFKDYLKSKGWIILRYTDIQ